MLVQVGAVQSPTAKPVGATAGVAVVVACIAGIAFLLLQILTFGYGRDQGIYAMVGRAILSGKMPYRDAWDFKPPGIFLIYAASRGVFGAGQVGIRIAECLGLIGMVGAMVRLTERWWGERRIGLFAGVIAVLVHAQLDFWHTAQPESFGGMVTIFALLVLGPGPWSRDALAPDPGAWRRWVASGALFGIAGLLKPPLAGGGAVVAFALAADAYAERRSIARALRPVLLVALGGALPLVLCLAWFGAKGALGDLWQVLFVFTPHYTALSWEGETVAGMLYWGFTEWLVTYSSVSTVGLLLVLGFRPSERERRGVLLLVWIIAVHLVGVTLQGKFFPYHYGATWPLTALVAGLGFFRLWERLGRLGASGPLLFGLAFALSALGRTATKDVERSFRERCALRVALFTESPRDLRAIDRLASVADVNAVANRAVAEALRSRVPEGRAVFIWGFEPVIYDLADRAPASRYLYDVPQRVAWAKETAREVLMRDLAAGRPAAIVVEHRDVFPMVTGDAIDSADTLASFPELRDLLAGRYRLLDSIEDFDVYIEL
jgi:4-amino-4-deoxy-L-arabinose transferase-like glycosyltransferase